MIREIKVRAYNTQLKERTNLGFYLDITGKIISNHEDIVVVEFSGVKDINGNEIFEGDVVKYKKKFTITKKNLLGQVCELDDLFEDRLGKVEFHGGVFIIVQGDNGSDSDTCLEESEVVGNIYVNPELVNQLAVYEEAYREEKYQEQNEK